MLRFSTCLLLVSLATPVGLHAAPVIVQDANDLISAATTTDARLYAMEQLATTHQLQTKRFVRDGKVQLLVQAPQIHYGEGDAYLHPKEYRRLQPIAELVQGNPLQIIVAGYSDTSATETMYDSVSDDRALEVARYLIQRGVEPRKITVVGRGPADPIADNTTRDGRRQNRRVEITVFSAL